MSVTPGTTLGPYEILSPLGSGGMGEVYRARDTRLGREVALKVLPAAVAQDAERLRRFQTEARSTSELNHPNILTVFDVGEHEGTSYIVSELLQGETLREHMEGAALSVRRATDYAVQIARGLAAAHERGVVHRDLKPENLFVTTDGRVKILDFGLARQVERVGPEGVDVEAATRKINTGPGVVMGTVGYMSPEQAAGRAADHRADIFSFGAVLYEMLSGRRAFRGETAVETLNAIIKDDPQEFAKTAERAAVPPALESVVWHCLEKRPERRFQSAGDLAFALEAVSGHSGSTGATVIAPAATAARAPRRERFIWAGLCALLALSSVALAVAYFARAPAAPRALRLAVPLPSKATFPKRVTVSPDGRSVVFVANNPEGKRVLWVRPLGASEAQPLPGTEGAVSPFWSPDSRFVGFFAAGKLHKIDAAGGRPQALCDAAEDRGGAWGRDGVILFAGIDGLYRVPAGGGAPALATRVGEKEEAHRWPYFLPDGRHFLFLGDAPRTEDHHVRLGSLDSAESRILFPAVSRIVYAPPGYLLYVRQGALVAQPFDAAALKLSGDPVSVAEHIAEAGLNHEYDFSASDDGVLAYQSGNPHSRLVWRDRAGAQTEAVGEPADYAAIALSPDGRRVVFSLLDADRRSGDLWLFDLSRGTNSRLTFDPQGDGDPIWSPDGTRVAFSSNRVNWHSNVYLKSTGGAGEDELLWQSDAEKFPTGWSRDGQLILFDNCEPKAKCGVWVQPVAGERRPRPYLRAAAFYHASGQFSPDGRMVAYASDESGRSEIYVQPFPTPGQKWQVSTAGGKLPQWRADGRELFYLSPDDRLMAVDVTAAGGAFESGPPRALFQTNMKHGYGGYGYAAAPDGQRFLINTPVEPPGTAPLMIVLDWTSGLRR